MAVEARAVHKLAQQAACPAPDAVAAKGAEAVAAKGAEAATGPKTFWAQGPEILPVKGPEAVTAKDSAGAETARLGAELRALAQKALESWHTPGFGLAVVRHGELLLAEGYGWRDVEKKLPVTPDTLFAIGSSSKAFTATALGMLVDEGKLDLDSPVRRYLPEFALADEATAAAISPRDLLTHRSGLPRHDMVWYGSSASRAELFQSLRYLPATAPLRTRFQYQNLMYMTAGLLLERLSGRSWEAFVAERIFAPLGMQRSQAGIAALQADPDHALPYRLVAERPARLPYRNLDAIGPAGGLNSSVRDMAQWLRFNLGDGLIPGEADPKAPPLLETATLNEIHAPQIVAAGSGPPESPYMLYGLGWFIQPYRGHSLIQHGGNIDGYSAMVALLPDSDTGIVILSNQNADSLPTALLYSICDRLYQLEAIDWNSRLKGSRPDDGQTPKAAPLQLKGTRPSHEPGEYAGIYSHPAYGEFRITQRGGQLIALYHDISGPLRHWHYDSFRLDQPDTPGDGLLLSFSSDELGAIASLSLSFEPEGEPIRFLSRPDPALSRSELLASYAGSYAVAGTPIELRLRNGELRFRLPGQPAYTLEPYRDGLFRIKGLKGYLVRFLRSGGRVVAAELIQPDGVYRANRIAD